METDKETISKLKFIGKIRKNEKINTQHMYVQPCGIITSIMRSIVYQDNRTNALNFVYKTIQDSFVLLQKYVDNYDIIMYEHLVEDLKNCKGGLESLKETYISDRKFCCDMDTIVQSIDSKLIEFEKSSSGETQLEQDHHSSDYQHQ